MSEQNAKDHRPRTILGLTGSIGMGKSTTAGLFMKHGVPVHDSDGAVHKLYQSGGAAARAIGQAFPGSLKADGAVNRDALRKAVVGNPEALHYLETLVHPLVTDESQVFLDRHKDAPLVVLDIPLLFETGAETRCDAVLVVTAPADVQRARVIGRPGMTEVVFEAIFAKQMSDAEKRARADFVIDTSLGFAHAEKEVVTLIARLTDSR